MKNLIAFVLLSIAATAAYGETYAHFFSVARQAAGTSIDSATVAVYSAGTTDLVAIYSDALGTPKANPFLSDAQGNYEFYVAPGLYKITITKAAVGTFTTDDIQIGTAIHASRHESGGADALSLGALAGTVNSTQILDATVANIDVAANAAIAESKLALNFPTHSNANDPSAAEKAALAGTSGAPTGANRYVTNNDSRNTNSRTPTAHAASHAAAGSDPITLSQSQLASKHAGTDLTADLEEESHASEHQNGGNDEISVTGLSGTLADPQLVVVKDDGVAGGTRAAINFVAGNNVTITTVDDVGNEEVDVTVGFDPPASTVEVDEGLTPITDALAKLWFNATHFSLTESPAGQANVAIDVSGLDTGGDLSGPVDNASVLFINGTELGDLRFAAAKEALMWDGLVWVPGTPDANAILLSGYEINDTPGNSEVPVFDTLTDKWYYERVNNTIEEITSVSPPNDPPNPPLTEARAGTTWLLDFGFDVTELGGDELKLSLDFSELTVDADQLQGTDIDTGAPANGEVLKYNSGTSKWEAASDLSGGAVAAKESDAVVIAASGAFDFGSGFDVAEAPAGEANITLDLTEITVDADKLQTYDVDVTVPTTGQTLLFDGDSWAPTIPSFSTVRTYDTAENEFAPIDTSSTRLLFLLPFIGATGVDGGTTYTSINLRAGGVNTTHIDWGGDGNQINSDDVPEGAVNKFLTAAQETGLVTSVDTNLHYHSSDRALGNATGVLTVDKIDVGITDAHVLNNLTLDTTATVSGEAIKSGTIADARLGDTKRQTKSFTFFYPETGLEQGFIYFPTTVTVVQVAGRVRGAGQTCQMNVKDDGTNVMAAHLTATEAGATSTSITNPTIAAGSWVSFMTNTCGSLGSVTEATITVVYDIQ